VNKQKNSLFSKVIAAISEMFLPIVNLMCASGILKGILIILTSTSVISSSSDTYLILYAISDSTFYFLPVLLAITSAKAFHTNPFYSTVVALVLLYPSITEAFGSGLGLDFLGLPIRTVSYSSSMIPIVMATAFLAVLERFLNKHIHPLITSFLTPLICITTVSLVTLFVFGPIGAIIGDVLAVGYTALYEFSSPLAGFILGGLIQPMVVFGIQWGLVLVALNNVTLTGFDSIIPVLAPSVFAQAGAGLAVFLKSKNLKFKAVCAPTVISAFFGVTEPVLFRVNVPRKRPFFFACLGGAVGGYLAGLSQIQTPAFVFPSVITLPVYYGDNFLLYLSGSLVGLLIGFFLTFFWGTSDEVEEQLNQTLEEN
jgi:beta-glucoside PTS system EIICBA component